MQRNLEFQTTDKIPIQTEDDLILYADRVVGSVTAMVCYLAWHILVQGPPADRMERSCTLIKAREMGQALQLVNIARDVHTDAVIGRCYIPMEMLEKGDLDALLKGTAHAPGGGSYARYTLPLLSIADEMRQSSEDPNRGTATRSKSGNKSDGGKLL
jgi:15-cis-phytoene synthase / lycopene beta-cyclase